MTCFLLPTTPLTSPLVMSNAENCYWEFATRAISLYLWCCRRSAPAGGASEALRPGAPAHCRRGAGIQAALHSQGEGVLTSRHPGAGHYLPASVADTRCLSRIKIFSIPVHGSKVKKNPRSRIQIPHPHQRILVFLTQKIVSKALGDMIRNRILIFYPSRSPDPGVKNALDLCNCCYRIF
jgi:hypothetical protein